VPQSPEDVRVAYDAVAARYAARFARELDSKPFDREILRAFAVDVGSEGTVCELGCGPGQIGGFLCALGVRVHGIDISAENLRQTRRLHPQLAVSQGDMLDLELASASQAGVVAFYSICHLTLPQVERVFAEAHRVLAPGGRLLVAFHVGDEKIHVDEFLGQTVGLDFVLFPVEAITRRLEVAGFESMEVSERDPIADVEAETRRAYARAQKAKG